MKRIGLREGSLLLIAMLVVAGCADDFATAPSEQATEMRRLVTQQEASDLMFKYRQQAMELREMAKRVEVEAQWYSGRFGQDDARAQENLEKATQLRAAAQEADQLAQEYGREVPHGQVY